MTMKSLILSLTAVCSLALGICWTSDASACNEGEDCHHKCHEAEQKCLEHCHDDACKHKCEEAEKTCNSHCK